MKRDDDDVFQPKPARFSSLVKNGVMQSLPAGPSPAWTAEGVIAALTELSVPERRERLASILSQRLDSVAVVLDQPHDPHNASAILRSCDAFGVQRVYVIQGSEHFAASRMVSMGSHRWVDVLQHDSPAPVMDHLKAQGFTTLVTHPQGRLQPEDLAGIGKVALILGNERDGVSPELSERADDTVQIPMCGFVESLNVSVSAAILVRAACLGRKGDLDPTELRDTYARWLRKSVPRADEVLSALKPC